MRTNVNLERIVMARESRGLNQAELAARLGIPANTYGKVERGELGMTAEVLERVAKATTYPVSFFHQAGNIMPDAIVYRRREKVAQRMLAPINANVDILRLMVQQLTELLWLATPKLPILEVNEKFTPAMAATKLRKGWDVPKGPIASVTALIEERGIPVLAFPFGTERVDSRAAMTEDKQPLICINSSHTWDRMRFSLAYQLGHLVMHTSGTLNRSRDVSHEANLFAAELLMPEKEMRQLFASGITIPLLGEMKRAWKVSMISLLYRADDLGYLTANQKRYLLQQFNEKKMRRREPAELDVPAEEPKLMRTWISRLGKRDKLNAAGLAARLHLHPEELKERFGKF